MSPRSSHASFVASAATLFAVSVLVTGCSRPAPDVTTGSTPSGSTAAATTSTPAAPDPLARGKYLIAIGGCNDCHTPLKLGPTGPQPDMARMFSGHPADMKLPPSPKTDGPWMWHGAATNTAFAGPWGISYAINLTPDQETGLGAWNEVVFLTALKTGKHLGVGRPIMPPMPWQGYSHMTDEDLKAVFAYLQSIPAITNKVPEAVEAAPKGN